MHTKLTGLIKHTSQGQQAEAIIRSCVHCGFCNAVCPTYRLLGDELDGPRGRIYLIKNLLENAEGAQPHSWQHLDRCLSCRACETVCPSGVQFSRLLDIGRNITAQQLDRPWRQQLLRGLLLICLPYPQRFKLLAALARGLRPLLPKRLRAKLPAAQNSGVWPPPRHARRMLVLDGCVQPALTPNINAAAARVLDKLGISLIKADNAGCCGALPYHLDDQSGGLQMMRNLIDTCWPQIEAGVEAIVSTTSGCGVQIKDYGHLLRNDSQYAEKAARVAGMAKDIGEILLNEDLTALQIKPGRIAFHAPCTLQHGLGLGLVVEDLLIRLGFSLTEVADAQLCCGSAGSYSLLQPEIADRLREAKLEALQAGQARLIATANIGCLLHLQEKAGVPVRHWIEVIDAGGL